MANDLPQELRHPFDDLRIYCVIVPILLQNITIGSRSITHDLAK